MNWETIHHLADVLGIVTIAGGFLWHRLTRLKGYRAMIVEDHQKIIALWREHGYKDWDGIERRKNWRTFKQGGWK